MARPTKSAKLLHERSQTKDEIEERINQEEKLKGQSDKIKPPSYLNSHQKKLFKYIVQQLDASGILGNLDVYILSTCVIAIDRLQEIERRINEDADKIGDKGLMAAKDKYTKDLFRCTNELSLSPASRAKLGNINLQAKQKEEDPLLKALQGSDNS
ncbi:phage terminase small subunit P27 family [Paenibacillus thailandensis]|uniref:Phage terminase small subunit P27 family n=1 Tax=Paenibacillus thailandensis TaxID=393250 RepID=A0ABW5R5G3_9BACL